MTEETEEDIEDKCELFVPSDPTRQDLNTIVSGDNGRIIVSHVKHANDLFRGNYPDFDDGVYELKVHYL